VKVPDWDAELAVVLWVIWPWTVAVVPDAVLLKEMVARSSPAGQLGFAQFNLPLAKSKVSSRAGAVGTRSLFACEPTAPVSSSGRGEWPMKP